MSQNNPIWPPDDPYVSYVINTELPLYMTLDNPYITPGEPQ